MRARLPAVASPTMHGGEGISGLLLTGTPLGLTSSERPGAIPRARAVIAGSARTVSGAEPLVGVGASMSASGPVNRVRPSPTRSSVDTRPPSASTHRCAIRPPRSMWVSSTGSRYEPRSSIERSTLWATTGRRSASYVSSSSSRAQPLSTQPSFQPRSWPSAIAAFIPVPPRGLTRCAASPIRNALPDRNRSAISAANLNVLTWWIRGRRSGTPAAVRIRRVSSGSSIEPTRSSPIPKTQSSPVPEGTKTLGMSGRTMG